MNKLLGKQKTPQPTAQEQLHQRREAELAKLVRALWGILDDYNLTLNLLSPHSGDRRLVAKETSNNPLKRSVYHAPVLEQNPDLASQGTYVLGLKKDSQAPLKWTCERHEERAHGEHPLHYLLAAPMVGGGDVAHISPKLLLAVMLAAITIATHHTDIEEIIFPAGCWINPSDSRHDKLLHEVLNSGVEHSETLRFFGRAEGGYRFFVKGIQLAKLNKFLSDCILFHNLGV